MKEIMNGHEHEILSSSSFAKLSQALAQNQAQLAELRNSGDPQIILDAKS